MIFIKSILVYDTSVKFNDDVNEPTPKATEKVGIWFAPKELKKKVDVVFNYFKIKYPGCNFELVMRDQTIEIKQQQQTNDT